MLILSADDVRRAVSPALAFDAVRDAFLRLSRDQIRAIAGIEIASIVS